MLTIVCFLLFFAAVVASVAADVTLIWSIWLGIALFLWVGRRRGHGFRPMMTSAWHQGKKIMPVIITFTLIGCITALWRGGGTIAFCIYYGTRLITPNAFLLVAFVLTSLLSYAIGTSFGVASTAGVILMALAKAGGVDVAATAGTVIAGAYFGDRCSPASSSATLVCAATETKLYDNLKMMRRTGWLPLGLTLVVYTVLSRFHPISTVDSALLEELAAQFDLRWWTMLPVVAIVVLPILKVPIRWAMGASIVASAGAAMAQGMAFWSGILPTVVLGYRPGPGPLQEILSGGGMISMLECSVLVISAGMYAGLLDHIGALDGVRSAVNALAHRVGLFPATVVTYGLLSAVFCNQTTGAVVTPQLLDQAYRQRGATNQEMALDLENSGIVMSPLIPWNIAGSIPLVMLGSDASAIPYEVLLYMIPLCYFFTKKYFYPPKEVSAQ